MEEKKRKRRGRKRRKAIELELDEKEFKARLNLENKALKTDYALSKLEHEILREGIRRSRRRKLPFEQWLAKAYEHYEEFWYTNPKGLQKISTEKICLILGCSQSMAQRIRSTLNQMSKEEVLELIGKRFGLR